MTSENDRLNSLLRALINERPEYSDIKIPASIADKRNLLRALMNVRMPAPIDQSTLKLQDDELATQRDEKGIDLLSDIPCSPVDSRLRLWQGDITRLAVDAIVNAANSQMLGCFVPLHKCIDNAIHSAAGIELRLECKEIMRQQGHDEPTGKAKITRGYNLPAKWVIHTVGPIVYGDRPSSDDCRLLADCYRSCLELAEAHHLSSIAFCCISTGEFHFPQQQAAQIAFDTVCDYFRSKTDSAIKAVVFNVFKDSDLAIYQKLLGYD